MSLIVKGDMMDDKKHFGVIGMIGPDMSLVINRAIQAQLECEVMMIQSLIVPPSLLGEVEDNIKFDYTPNPINLYEGKFLTQDQKREPEFQTHKRNYKFHR